MDKIEPGYAIKFDDGTWLGAFAHSGWGQTDDPFEAEIFNTIEKAEKCTQDYIKDLEWRNEGDVLHNKKLISMGKEPLPYTPRDTNLKYSIIEAWEPKCYYLNYQNERLTDANKITPSEIFNIEESIEEIEEALKNIKKILK